jgi:hypothetical protein
MLEQREGFIMRSVPHLPRAELARFGDPWLGSVIDSDGWVVDDSKPHPP